MRTTKQLELQTAKGLVTFTVKELSAPAVRRLTGPAARVLQKLFAGKGPEGVKAGLAGGLQGVLGILAELDGEDFEKLEAGLFRGNVTARVDGADDATAGEHLAEYFEASQLVEYLTLFWEALYLSYEQVFSKLLPAKVRGELESVLRSAAAVTSAPLQPTPSSPSPAPPR